MAYHLPMLRIRCEWCKLLFFGIRRWLICAVRGFAVAVDRLAAQG